MYSHTFPHIVPQTSLVSMQMEKSESPLQQYSSNPKYPKQTLLHRSEQAKGSFTQSLQTIEEAQVRIKAAVKEEMCMRLMLIKISFWDLRVGEEINYLIKVYREHRIREVSGMSI